MWVDILLFIIVVPSLITVGVASIAVFFSTTIPLFKYIYNTINGKSLAEEARYEAHLDELDPEMSRKEKIKAFYRTRKVPHGFGIKQ